jgi:L-fuconolactonase
MQSMTPRSPLATVRPEWLASQFEPALDPHQPIIDSHHHLYDRPGQRYLLDEFTADLGSGHNIVASVFLQARTMYRTTGPDELRSVGETEFAMKVAAAAAQAGRPGVCSGIVGYANLLLGDRVRPVLEAHLKAAGRTTHDVGRLCGIRHIAAWDPDNQLLNPAYPTTEDMFERPAFRNGFMQLHALGLRFDAWVLFHQIPRLTALARAFPGVPIVLNHCGGILGVGGYDGKHGDIFAAWSRSLKELSTCPNVMVKIGGLGMPQAGFKFEMRPLPPSSLDLAEAWRPWVETCITLFGADRCMFESNFPVDKLSYGYSVGWNAFKRLATRASAAEKDDLFWKSAGRFYGLRDLVGNVA